LDFEGGRTFDLDLDMLEKGNDFDVCLIGDFSLCFMMFRSLPSIIIKFKLEV